MAASYAGLHSPLRVIRVLEHGRSPLLRSPFAKVLPNTVYRVQLILATEI
jgi:hypothetical protein